MKIIIYHGKPGTGKTTQLVTAAMKFSKDYNEALKIVQGRKILMRDGEQYMFIDEFTSDDFKLIDEFNTDWLYIGTQYPYFAQFFEKTFASASIWAERETLFPLCNYMDRDEFKYIADFGAITFNFNSREELITELSKIAEKEVEIENMAELLSFCEKNKEYPHNMREWSMDHAHLMRFYEKARKSPENKVVVTDDEACAISNYWNNDDPEWIDHFFFSLFRNDETSNQN